MVNQLYQSVLDVWLLNDIEGIHRHNYVLFKKNDSSFILEKRLKKDAGRQRWSPYYRGGNGGLKHEAGGDSDGGSQRAMLDTGSDNSLDGFSSEYGMYTYYSKFVKDLKA